MSTNTNTRKKLHKDGLLKCDERGQIAIETTLIFVPFVVIVISILSLINIVSLQARVQYAMTQTALTLSKYSYVLEITGLADEFKAMDEAGSTARTSIGNIKDGIGEIFDGISDLSGGDTGQLTGVGQAGSEVIKEGQDLFSNPGNIFQMLLSDAKDFGFSLLARELVGRYLSNGDVAPDGSFRFISGSDYLKTMGVRGGKNDLDFFGWEFYYTMSTEDNNSKFIDKDGNITLVVSYKVPYTFMGFKLPFNEINISQAVSTKAWLGGSGIRYK